MYTLCLTSSGAPGAKICGSARARVTRRSPTGAAVGLSRVAAAVVLHVQTQRVDEAEGVVGDVGVAVPGLGVGYVYRPQSGRVGADPATLGWMVLAERRAIHTVSKLGTRVIMAIITTIP